MQHSRRHIRRSTKLFWFFIGILLGILLPHVVALIELGADRLQQFTHLVPARSDKMTTFSYQSVRKVNLQPLAQTIAKTLRSKKHSEFLLNLAEQPAAQLIENYLALFTFDQQQCRILRLFFKASADFIQQLPTTYPLYKQYTQGTLGFNLPALAKLRGMQKQYETSSLFMRRLVRTITTQLATAKRSEHPTRSLQALSDTSAEYLRTIAEKLCPAE